jgi:hypothetical protein
MARLSELDFRLIKKKNPDHIYLFEGLNTSMPAPKILILPRIMPVGTASLALPLLAAPESHAQHFVERRRPRTRRKSTDEFFKTRQMPIEFDCHNLQGHRCQLWEECPQRFLQG